MDLDSINQIARFLRAFASPIRLAILYALRDGEKNVHDLEKRIGTTQPNISMHLANLRDKNILTSRKEANQVFYKVKDMRIYEMLGILNIVYARD